MIYVRINSCFASHSHRESLAYNASTELHTCGQSWAQNCTLAANRGTELHTCGQSWTQNCTLAANRGHRTAHLRPIVLPYVVHGKHSWNHTTAPDIQKNTRFAFSPRSPFSHIRSHTCVCVLSHLVANRVALRRSKSRSVLLRVSWGLQEKAEGG